MVMDRLGLFKSLVRDSCHSTFVSDLLSVVVFVGLPVVDHMDDGIGCFVRACEKKSVRRKLLLKAVEFR